MFRYMVLHVEGGLYSDLDMECLINYDNLLEEHKNYDIIFYCHGTEKQEICNNGIMISKPNNGLWIEMIEYGLKHKNLHVISCTGPPVLGKHAFKNSKKYNIKMLNHYYDKIIQNNGDSAKFKCHMNNEKLKKEKELKYKEWEKKGYHIGNFHGTPKDIHWVNVSHFTNYQPQKIGFIIPSRTIFKDKKKNIKMIQDLPIIKYLLPSFQDKCDKNGKYSYNFYVGYDYDDTFYKENKLKIIEFIKRNFNIKNLNISFIEFDKSYSGGKVAAIWSELANIAVKNNCEYLYQLGYDIIFKDSGWENKFITKLQENNNLGVVGPLDLNNSKLLTQSFVHKTHLDIFKTYYPKEIVNIYCDDWIPEVYKPDRSFILQDVKVMNSGGLSLL